MSPATGGCYGRSWPHDWDHSYAETGVLVCRKCGAEHYNEALVPVVEPSWSNRRGLRYWLLRIEDWWLWRRSKRKARP